MKSKLFTILILVMLLALSAIAAKQPVKMPKIIKIGSDSCYPCRMMNPIMKELAVEQEGKAVFMNLDIYKNRELASKYGVRVIPTIIFLDKHGKLKAKTEGFMSKEQILKMINKLELKK